MKLTILIPLISLSCLAGCGGGGGNGHEEPPVPGGGYPHGRLDGWCRDVNGPEFGCWLEVDGENVEWGLQSGTRGVPGTLKGGKLKVGPYDSFVNVGRNRVWLVGRLDVRGGDR